jgi:hypothetical protein
MACALIFVLQEHARCLLVVLDGDRWGSTGEGRELTEGWLRGGGDYVELEATQQLSEDGSDGSHAATQTRLPSSCSTGRRQKRKLHHLLDRTQSCIRKGRRSPVPLAPSSGRPGRAPARFLWRWGRSRASVMRFRGAY